MLDPYIDIPPTIPTILIETTLNLDKWKNKVWDSDGKKVLGSLYKDAEWALKRAMGYVRHIDPLALDLDGDSIETVSADAGITFDHDGDGVIVTQV